MRDRSRIVRGDRYSLRHAHRLEREMRRLPSGCAASRERAAPSRLRGAASGGRGGASREGCRASSREGAAFRMGNDEHRGTYGHVGGRPNGRSFRSGTVVSTADAHESHGQGDHVRGSIAPRQFAQTFRVMRVWIVRVCCWPFCAPIHYVFALPSSVLAYMDHRTLHVGSCAKGNPSLRRSRFPR